MHFSIYFPKQKEGKTESGGTKGGEWGDVRSGPIKARSKST